MQHLKRWPIQPEVLAAMQRSLDRLEKWAVRKLMKVKERKLQRLSSGVE